MNYYDEINPHIAEADMIIKNLFYLLSPLYKKDFAIGQDITIPLFTTLHSTSESILILLMNQSIFDADVLLRTVMEGTIKYCYLMIGNVDERKEKLYEYKTTLTEIDKLIDHGKALETIEILKHFSINSTKPFEISVLDNNELETLQKLFPAKKRNEIKTKWSYQNLLRELATNNDEYKVQLGSLSTYSLTSHLIHYDWTGVSLRQAQISDAPYEDAVIFDIGHAIRIISNMLSFYIFRVAEYVRCNSYNSVDVAKLSMNAIDYINKLIQLGNSIIENNANKQM